MQPGQLILLNGTSSAGKSTIAKELQTILPQPYLHTGLDHFLAATPRPLYVYTDSDAAASTPGWLHLPCAFAQPRVRLGLQTGEQ